MGYGWDTPFGGSGDAGEHSHIIADTTGLQTALDGKEAAGVASNAIVAHEAASNPHPVYLTPAEADVLYEALGAVATHEAASDPHTVYQRESEKAAVNGYASLDSGTLVPAAQLATGTPDGTKFLRDDRSWQVPAGGSGDSITINGTAVTNADFDDATPAAPASSINVRWQQDAGSPANLSANLPFGASLGTSGGVLARAALTGDVTAALDSNATTIANDAVTYAKLQNVSATARLLGRSTAGAGDPEELTGTQTTTLLDVFTSGLKGLAPASGGGTTNFLRADGSWAAPGGGPGGGPTVLGSDVTCTLTASYCTVFTIPLTASSGNRIDVNMVGDSNTAGGSIQMRVQFDNA